MVSASQLDQLVLDAVAYRYREDPGWVVRAEQLVEKVPVATDSDQVEFSLNRLSQGGIITRKAMMGVSTGIYYMTPQQYARYLRESHSR